MTGLLKVLVEIRDELRRIRAFSASSMSVDDAADCLGVSRATLTKWIDDGRITPVRNTGRRVLIARVEVDRFTAGQPSPDRRARAPLTVVN